MSGELMHFSDKPVVLDRARSYSQDAPHSHGKPVGFWVSVAGEDDWPTWCLSEEFRLGSLVFAHRITLDPWSKILRILSPEGIDSFHDKYATRTDFDRRYHPEWSDRRYWPVDWNAVAADFDGVVIAPYQWSRRLQGPHWYYTWDCASGCIWNLSAIESVEPFSFPALTAGVAV